MILFLTHLAFIEIVESCLEKKHFLVKKVYPNKTNSNYLQSYYVYCGKFNLRIFFLIWKHLNFYLWKKLYHSKFY